MVDEDEGSSFPFQSIRLLGFGLEFGVFVEKLESGLLGIGVCMCQWSLHIVDR